MSPILSETLSAVLPYVASILASALSLVGIWAVKQLGKKLGVETTAAIDQQVWDLAHRAVSYAEEQALKAIKAGQTAPSSADKLKTALAFLDGLVKSNGWDKIAEDKLIAMIEAALHVQRPVMPRALVAADPK
jgi:hypothetical protein